MRLGIVGSEGAKFTAQTRERARREIRKLLRLYKPSEVVSGACHLGGIDIWAAEEAKAAGIKVVEYPPAKRCWIGGYRERNLQIVRRSHAVICITLKELPKTYQGMRFNVCYHCGTDDHVKSGGCWTTKQARKVGKEGRTIVISP